MKDDRKGGDEGEGGERVRERVRRGKKDEASGT